MTTKSILLALIGLSLLAACQPRVTIEAPEKPIVINLNIKIEHEIRLKVEKDVEELLKKDKDLF
ncbi:MAG: YnbE family lipoprotein [Deltaproteobacteria bacterium]|nr:YnbE family lipoprotein [Deltaproteobacteria bacterium]